MGFLKKILGRPDNERPFVLIPVGYPAGGAEIPEFALSEKPLDEISDWI
jgi:iodotyrosine deiodinase